ncbi:hypothetical protein QYE76_010515 [Lolium multiflorum]|uniref:F-box domain-containing protein n=1 Tax=Lolium multiflorum TaxID=4521 RepID=A0AAD8TX65_LOLMU|nr:hypothetical protein QYE76_010515 [Lolium multiflorum]
MMCRCGGGHLGAAAGQRAKSALRCRCLSHAWAARLSSDHFADRHFRLANRHGGPRILLLHVRGSPGPKEHMWSPDHPAGRKLMDIPRNLTFDPRKPGNRVPRLVTQHCRGLIVLDATAVGIQYVYNPSTGRMSPLPEGRPTGCSSPSESKEKYASLGLGYDEQTARHIVVRICYRGWDANKLPLLPRCEIYVVNSSMETGLWRPTRSDRPPAGWVNQHGTSVFARGHVYWLGQPRLKSPPQEMFIVSFSLLNETFDVVPPPPALDLGSKGLLTVLDGHPCLFCNMWPSYEVYLLREADEWDLRYRIDTSPSRVGKLLPYMVGLQPIASIDDGHRIVLIQPRYPWCCATSFRLCAYAPAAGETRSLLQADSNDGSNGLLAHKTMALGHAAFYEESILPTGQRHENIIFAMSLVLRRLPECTLLKIMCVCKTWRAIIQSDRFAHKRRLMCWHDFIHF